MSGPRSGGACWSRTGGRSVLRGGVRVRGALWWRVLVTDWWSFGVAQVPHTRVEYDHNLRTELAAENAVTIAPTPNATAMILLRTGS